MFDQNLLVKNYKNKIRQILTSQGKTENEIKLALEEIDRKALEAVSIELETGLSEEKRKMIADLPDGQDILLKTAEFLNKSVNDIVNLYLHQLEKVLAEMKS